MNEIPCCLNLSGPPLDAAVGTCSLCGGPVKAKTEAFSEGTSSGFRVSYSCQWCGALPQMAPLFGPVIPMQEKEE